VFTYAQVFPNIFETAIATKPIFKFGC